MSKTEDCFQRFLRYLDEEYEWIAFSLRNAQITQIIDTETMSSMRSSTPETVTMSSLERDRDRRMRQERMKHHHQHDEVRDR